MGKELPNLSIKDFILRILNEAPREVSIDEIYVFFSASGYGTPRASIRGRLNSLTADGEIRRVSRGVYQSIRFQDTRFYNLIMSGSPTFWDDAHAEMHRSRFLEYTDSAIVEQFKSLDSQARARLLALPTLFAYEAGANHPARVGKLIDISINKNTIAIWFEFDQKIPPISPSKFTEIRMKLGIDADFELNRTHWAIKAVSTFTPNF